MATTELLPSILTEQVPVTTWAIAIGVLLLSGLVVGVLRRRENARAMLPLPSTPVSPSPVAANAAALETVGEAMIDAGYTVMTVHETLLDIARVNGYPRTEVVVMPTALFVTSRTSGEVRTGVVSSGHHPLLLHQINDLDRIITEARSGALPANRARALVRLMRLAPPPHSRLVRIAAYIPLCGALAVLLGGSWMGVLVASLLGAIVGTAITLGADLPASQQPLITVTISFGCALAVFLIARLGYDVGVLPALVAPLVVLLPGALLTTGVLELATGQMVSGASRLAAGFMRLLLLATGIVAAGALVGVPRIELVEAYQPLGWIAPWIAIAVFGAAIVINRGGRASSTGWIVLVLYIAYAGQVLGDMFFGAVLAGFVGALVMTPVAAFVARLPNGPAGPVIFLPAFWMLVPGSLGLVGVTTALEGNQSGASTIVTTISTMLAIALGVLAGSAIKGRKSRARTLL